MPLAVRADNWLISLLIAEWRAACSQVCSAPHPDNHSSPALPLAESVEFKNEQNTRQLACSSVEAGEGDFWICFLIFPTRSRSCEAPEAALLTGESFASLLAQLGSARSNQTDQCQSESSKQDQRTPKPRNSRQSSMHLLASTTFDFSPTDKTSQKEKL